MARQFTAPTEERQLGTREIYRETQKWYLKVFDVCSRRVVAFSAMAMSAILPVVIPSTFDFCRLVFLFFAIVFYAQNKRIKLPLKLPMISKALVDYNDPRPGRKAYFKPSGMLYLGNDEKGYELWLKDTDIKTHMLIYGTTGSGKTVSLQSISWNTFVLGTGLCYIDPKGDPKLAHELFIMSRRVSREDDFLAMDFMTGGKSAESRTPFRMSNTLNPFATAPADAITNLLTSLLPKEDGGGNSVFQQKAIALLTALIPVLTQLRDAKVSLPMTDMSNVPGINRAAGSIGSGLNIAIIRDFLEPAACVSLVFPLKSSGGGMRRAPTRSGAESRQPESGGDVEECTKVAEIVDKATLDVFRAALSSLNYTPGGKPPLEQQSYLDQFGYAKGYFGAPLASLSGMYGHLFNVSAGEIDMYDVLFDRRILVAILPSLEKSPQECENLGKIILASVKNSVSGGLGDKFEGKTREITGALPSASKVPGIIIVDEYAAIMMPGFEVILTQARSLGFMAIIASQDYSGMKGKDAKSCDQIVENTKIKLFMTMASAKETWDLAKALFGEINVEEKNLQDPERRGTIRTINKVNPKDLMDQIEGEFHAFYKGVLIRGATPYMIPESDKKNKNTYNVRINRFIRTDCAPEYVRKNIDAARRRLRNSKEMDLNWKEALRLTMLFPFVYEIDPDTIPD